MSRRKHRSKQLKNPIHAKLQALQDKACSPKPTTQQQPRIETDDEGNEHRVVERRRGRIIRSNADAEHKRKRRSYLGSGTRFDGLSAGSDGRYSPPDRDNPHDRYGLKSNGAYSNAKRHRYSWEEVAAKSGEVFSITIGPDGEEVKTPIAKGSPKKKKFGRIKSAVVKHTDQEVARLRNLDYADYLLTDHWYKVRTLKLKSVGSRCETCQSSQKLEVHHIHYSSRGHERLIDLKALCSECHDWFHRTHHIHRR